MREVRDSMGVVKIDDQALWGAQTQRALQNFQISGQRMPTLLIHTLAALKGAVATVHAELGLLDRERATAIVAAAAALCAGKHDDAFPLDVFQTGSATSTNMNVNEVIATLCARGGVDVHPNDHVNIGQSSNDVIPSAIQIAALRALNQTLLPAVEQLIARFDGLAQDHRDQVKTGRTHLMDAMPMTFGQEFATFAAQLQAGVARLQECRARVQQIPLGGTAIGTGINADPRVAAKVCARLNAQFDLSLRPHSHPFVGIAAKDELVELSGQLNTVACSLMKIANDLRWMNSGPMAGLGEIQLAALQPGSSIMPGKVNPVIPEALAMVCAQVMGNHTAITIAGQSGNFQLNVMLPLIARNLLESLQLLANGCHALATLGLDGLSINQDRVDAVVARNPILVTALNALIGYERAAGIAKKAYAQGRPIVAVAAEETDMSTEKLSQLLDPLTLTRRV